MTNMSKSFEIVNRSQELKYSLYKKSFDPDTRQFGPRELVFSPDTLDQSAVLPRISPDGRFLLFTMASYGYFHIWHHDADLWMLNLQSGEVRPLKEANSPDTESYHTWSSSGRWIVFSSRRDDGTFTRPFFAHMDKDGNATKPFELPQADPDYHRQFLRCYNIPEFMLGPVTISPQTFADVLKGEAEPVKYVNTLSGER
jgi:dipeptidyl aminopeptidase/acylaminoacyl peptidase